MPTNQAVAREVRLIKAVARWLRDQGKPCKILGWPDREPAAWPAGLTVEAVLAVGAGQARAEWATDAMTVPVPSRAAAGMAEARQEIIPKAANLAEKGNRAVTVSIRFPDGNHSNREAYYRHVLDLVEEALQTGNDFWDESGADPETQVVLSRREFVGDPSGPSGAVRVHLVPFVGTSPDLLADLRTTLAEPLKNKLGNQLKRAKDLGFETLLVLDQGGHAALPAGTAWLPSAITVARVVAECDASYPGVLDAVVLAEPGDSLVQIFGSGL